MYSNSPSPARTLWTWVLSGAARRETVGRRPGAGPGDASSQSSEASPPFWLLLWDLDLPKCWAGNQGRALLPLALLPPLCSRPNWRAGDYWLKFPSDLHARRGSVFCCPPTRSARTAASLGMRSRGHAGSSRTPVVSWRPATWHPRPDMGRLSRPGSSTGRRNLPVRAGGAQVAGLWAVPSPGGFSNL